MEVILQENYPSLGFTGDIVKVRRGFARNFLLPRGIALEISARNARVLKHKIEAINAKKAKIRTAAEEEAKKLSALSLDFTLKMGKGAKSFGSITTRDIEKSLAEQGVVVDRRQIKLADAMKKVGNYEVKIKLHSDVTATIKVNLKSETEKAEAKQAEQKAERKAKRQARGDKKESKKAHSEKEDTVAASEEAAAPKAKKAKKAKSKEQSESKE